MEPITLSKQGFTYTFKFRRPRAEDECSQLYITAEHDSDKREWSKIIDNHYCKENGLAPLTPEILIDIFKNEISDDNKLQNYYTIEFPKNVKDETGSLMIIIKSKNYFPELCQEYVISLPSSEIPITTRLQKQLTSCQEEYKNRDREILDLRIELDTLRDKFFKLRDDFAEHKFNTDSHNIYVGPNTFGSGVETRGMRRNRCNNKYDYGINKC